MVTGLSLLPSGRPLCKVFVPSNDADLPYSPWSSDGVKPITGRPLNQKSAPAASFSAVVWPLGLSSGVGLAPLPTNSTVWNPVGANFTLSPTCTEIELGKK